MRGQRRVPQWRPVQLAEVVFNHLSDNIAATRYGQVVVLRTANGCTSSSYLPCKGGR